MSEGESIDGKIDDVSMNPAIVPRFEDITVPTVLVANVENFENKPWRDPSCRPSDYFNYGYNETTWGKYIENVKAKLTDLNKAIREQKLHLGSDKDIMKFLFNFPSDYGGMGEVYEDNKYENLNFFEYKTNKNKSLPQFDLKQGSVYVPLDITSDNLNNMNGMNQGHFNNIQMPNGPNPNMPAMPVNMPFMSPFNYGQMQQNMFMRMQSQMLNRMATQTHNPEAEMKGLDYRVTTINQFSPSEQNEESKRHKSSKKKSKKEKKHNRSRSRDRRRSRSKSKNGTRRKRSSSSESNSRDKKKKKRR